MTNALKPCVECKWCRKVRYDMFGPDYLCRHPFIGMIWDAVTGNRQPSRPCKSMRKRGILRPRCGPEGAWWDAPELQPTETQ